ncbi:MAG TPA: hypothetical protein PK308_04425, partial [Phycisphaerales bacterium]|nr:hypothetical protein [Phycisphaerales bacterium]
MNRLRRFAAPFGLAVVALLSRTAVADEIINVSYMCSYGSTIRVADSSGAASNVLFAWPDEVRWDTMFKIIRGDVALIVDTTC